MVDSPLTVHEAHRRRDVSADDMMTVVAARALRDNQVCFVGIGIPSAAANIARRLHAPNIVLVYESGAIGAKPSRLPLSVGDGELSNTADSVVPMPEIFNYWLQGRRIHVGMLSAAQIDRYANLNSTVIGDYARPRVRLPGAGGAPEIASSCEEVIVVMRHSRRTFVEEVDFVTSMGYGRHPDDRRRLGLRGRGPTMIITNLGVLHPHPRTCELVLTHLHPGVSIEAVQAATGWDLLVASDVEQTTPPTDAERSLLQHLFGQDGG